jgi:hypothetical protein
MKTGQSVYWNARPNKLTLIFTNGESVILPRCKFAGAIRCLGAAYAEGQFA